jgi:hypothetical protein
MATFDEYQYDDMTSVDFIEDVENKLEDLLEEKFEILFNLIKLRFVPNIDDESYQNICLFLAEVFREASYEQIVLNKLYDYLVFKLDEIGYENLENSRMFLEYLGILSYFDDVEDKRVEEYMLYLGKIEQLVRVNAVSPSYLQSSRQNTELDPKKMVLIYTIVPEIKQ